MAAAAKTVKGVALVLKRWCNDYNVSPLHVLNLLAAIQQVPGNKSYNASTTALLKLWSDYVKGTDPLSDHEPDRRRPKRVK